MKIKGIKRGQTIELSQELNIPDGQEILIEISESQLMSEEDRQQKLKEFFSRPWSDEDREEWAKIGEELDRERREKFERLQTHKYED